MLKGNVDMLEAKYKLVYFIFSQRVQRNISFIILKECIGTVSTHAVFLDKDYMMTESCRDLILEEVSGQARSDPVLQDSQPVEHTSILPSPVSNLTPQCSGRSTRALDMYIYLGEFLRSSQKLWLRIPLVTRRR